MEKMKLSLNLRLKNELIKYVLYSKVLVVFLPLFYCYGCKSPEITNNAQPTKVETKAVTSTFSTTDTLLAQNFNSSSSLPTYISATPNYTQFNSIGATTGSTVQVTNNKLRFTRNTGGNAHFSRTSDFTSIPSIIQYKFDIEVSGNSAFQTVATFQVGENFSSGNTSSGTPLESDANVNAKIAIYTTGTNGVFSIKDKDLRSANFAGNQTVTWLINESDTLIRYASPDGKIELVSANSWDLWLGSTKVFDDRPAITASKALKNLKFAFTAGTGVTIDLDNISVLNLSQSQNTDIAVPLFSSGFENSTYLALQPNNTILYRGTDFSVAAPNNWESLAPEIGNVKINFEGGDTTQRKAKIVNDPTNPNNKVLYYWLAKANALNFVKGRVQTDAYDGTGVKELYQSVRMYLGDGFNTIKNWNKECDWLTIFEFWNNKAWDDAPNPFRIKVTIAKPSAAVGTPLNFRVTAQTYNTTTGNFSNKWEATNTSYTVPVMQWFTIDYYYKEGDGNNGRFYLAIKPDGGAKTVLFNEVNWTQSPTDTAPDGLTDVNIMKLYTSKDLLVYLGQNGKVLEIYWDNLQVWKDKRP